jgi:predicted nucleic acid-binding protein
VRYLLDTDVAILWLRGVERARQRVRTAAREGLGISYISVAELYDGIYQSVNREAGERQIDELFFGLDFVSLDRETAAIFGRERARLRRSGTSSPISTSSSPLRPCVTASRSSRTIAATSSVSKG